jgi:hypothetical protein
LNEEHNPWWYAKFCGGVERASRLVRAVFMTPFCYEECGRREREFRGKDKKCDGSVRRAPSNLETIPANGPIKIY